MNMSETLEKNECNKIMSLNYQQRCQRNTIWGKVKRRSIGCYGKWKKDHLVWAVARQHDANWSSSARTHKLTRYCWMNGGLVNSFIRCMYSGRHIVQSLSERLNRKLKLRPAILEEANDKWNKRKELSRVHCSNKIWHWNTGYKSWKKNTATSRAPVSPE